MDATRSAGAETRRTASAKTYGPRVAIKSFWTPRTRKWDADSTSARSAIVRHADLPDGIPEMGKRIELRARRNLCKV